MVELLGLIFTALIYFIPGLALSLGLFSGTKFGKLDRLFASLILPVVLIPLLLFLEYLLLGIKLNAFLVLANALLLFFVGIALLYMRSQLTVLSSTNLTAVLQREKKNAAENPLRFAVPAALMLIVFFAFYFRIAYSFITNFFEFDPYYYTFLTEMLVQSGAIPFSSDISYFPLVKFHHEPAMMQYLAGSWYLLYNLFTGLAYDKGTLILITNIYPPLMGAFLSILAFWLLKAQYGELAGLTGAIFFASTPQLLQKFAAGVAELQPWGVFSALLIFAAFTLALKHKEWQFTAFAALATIAAILGAVQAMWPVGVIAAFFIIQAFVNYYAGHNELKLATLAVVFSVSVFFAFLLYNLYSSAPIFTFPIGILVALVSCFPAVVFYLLSRSKFLASRSRKQLMAAILVIGFLVSLLPVFPNGKSASNLASEFVEVTSAFATYAGPLSRTIAEETPTDPGVLAGAFGILGPFILLLLALIMALTAVEVLLLKNKPKHAIAFIAIVLGVVLLRSSIADFSIAFGTSTGLSILSTLGRLLGTNEVFAFLVAAILSSVISFVYSAETERSEASLLTILVVYPVAYIGLNKVKFLLHLGFALVVAVGAFIGEVVNRAKFIHEYFKVGKTPELSIKWTTGFALLVLVILGSVQVFGFPGKAPGVVASVQPLGGSQISSDWLSAMEWLRNNTGFYNPSIVNNCKRVFGHDCRVMSWWDYGHWTAFLGETKTALDPGNSYEFLDQQVAYGFVDNQTAFRKNMGFHNASHVLVDFQLIDKWGALVFLSGTCQKDPYDSGQQLAPNCPDSRQIVDWKKGAGQSEYEFEHYFERLTLGQQCPFSQNMLLAQSSFGLAYCISQEQVIPLDRDGLRTDLARPFQLVGLNAKVENIDEKTHYFIPLSQTSFVNVNPDFSLVGKQSKLINSTFVRLYVFENLPGFELAYRSPAGEVKIFRRTFNARDSSVVESQATSPEASAPLPLDVAAPNTTNESQNSTNAAQNVSG